MQNNLKTKNQTALICGASGRVGSSIAKIMAAKGFNTIIQYRQNRDQADQIVDEISATGGEALAVQADVTTEQSVQAMVSAIQQRYETIHILVNAVHGQFDPKEIIDMNWNDWTVHLDALKGHFLLCKAVLPMMRSQHYGRIIYISGGLSSRYFKGCSAYTTIKAGLNGFCKTLAIEEGRNGITANIVAPGKVAMADGGESTDNPQAWEKLNQQSIVNNPLGRYATTDDVANAVMYFAYPESSGITGQTLFVAGGEIML
jgi:3-oxoacyl-[acyl-carrier protein] reductase